MRIAATIRLAFAATVLASMLVTAASCNQKDSNIGMVSGTSQEEADRLNSRSSAFDKMPQDPPLNADTHFAAGQLAESQNASQQALNQYGEALKLNPKHQMALFRSGVVLAQLRQYPQAIEMWKRYVAATNGDAIGYSNLAFCYELAGKNADAETAYKQAIARDPKCTAARNNYGLMLVRTGRVDEGLGQFLQVLKPAEANYNVASVLEQMGKKDQARNYYNRALQLDPKFEEARKRLAAIN